MQVDDALIEKLSRLAMLQFDDPEKQAIKNDLEKMIGFVDKLKELDTTGVEPLLHMNANTNVFREDETATTISTEDALKNSPHHDEKFFKVPKVIRKNNP